MTATVEAKEALEVQAPTTKLGPSRLLPTDVLTVGSSGLRSRKTRTALSALGIMIGIAAMVGVLGLSDSSQADLRKQIEALGTNLLTVSPGSGFGAGDGVLPEEAAAKIGRIGPVEITADVVTLEQVPLRNNFVNSNETSGITAVAADTDLLATLNGAMAAGQWFDDATAATTNVVLGSVAAERHGIVDVSAGVQLSIGGEWFTVIGILEPFPLAADLDRSVLIGKPVAHDLFGVDLNPSIVYVRTDPQFVDDVRAVLPATADPASPEEVEASRPSELLETQNAIEDSFTNLFLGLGAVSLLVGGVGIANVMVIAVIERRNEIGLRRALGATRAHIRRQFLTESLLL
ncbi:MAG: ABC transporter permease, partial [Acidimicrobiales bacterium]